MVNPGPLVAQPLPTGASPVPKEAPPRAFHVMTKPIGPICNLDCRYCFYLEKEDLYAREGRRERPSWEMPPDVLESYIRQYVEAQEVPEVSFAWQGGEPTLLGVRFFERVVQLQKRYAAPLGKRVTNALQTNGTLLTDEWCHFLRSNNFLVGLSVDGPPHLHDAYRVDKRGRPTFDRVKEALDRLQRHGVEFNTLTVVHRQNAAHPLEVYRFLRDSGSRFLQFIPLVERAAPAGGFAGENGLIRLELAPPPRSGEKRSPVTDWSVRSEDWGAFLVAVFDEWVRRDVGRSFVQAFDVALGIWAGVGSSLCVHAETCGHALAIEHNGDVYACDHYVYPEYRRGNLREQPLTELLLSEAQQRFGNDKRDTLPGYCRQCEVRFACQGECPKHRFLRTPDGEFGLNYLCAGYRRYFNHISPYMEAMAELLHAGRAPAEIMRIVHLQDEHDAARTPTRSPGRNDICPCGSGKKYKRCCLRG